MQLPEYLKRSDKDWESDVIRVSKSLHFWRTSSAEMLALAEKHSVSGRFICANARWASALILDTESEKRLLAAATGIAMVWWYVSGCSLTVAFRRAGRPIGEMRFAPDCSVKWSSQGPTPLLSQLVQDGVLDGPAVDELEDLAREVRLGTTSGQSVRARAAAILGIAAYEQLSGDTCNLWPLEEFRKEYPNAEDFGEGSDKFSMTLDQPGVR